MEKSKPSPEEILKLGEKIVKELNEETRFDTLSNWMANYVAELIHKVQNCTSKTERKKAEEECCDIILKIWSKRNYISGIKAPITDLNPLIEILEVINRKNNPKRLWRFFPDELNDSNRTMKDFVETVKSNTEDIFLLSLYSTLGDDLIKQKKELKENFENFLNEDEIKLLDQIDQLINFNQPEYISSEEKDNEQKKIQIENLSSKEWHEFILNRIEFHLDEQKEQLQALKEKYLN